MAPTIINLQTIWAVAVERGVEVEVEAVDEALIIMVRLTMKLSLKSESTEAISQNFLSKSPTCLPHQQHRIPE